MSELRVVPASVEEKAAFEEALKTSQATKRANGIADDADHYLIARAFVENVKAQCGEAPVCALGKFWRFDGGIWKPTDLDQVAVEVGSLYGGYRYCRRGSEFRAVATVVAGLCADAKFFDNARTGIAAGHSFWRVNDGRIEPEPLTAAHRQRLRLAEEPEFDSPAPLWNGLLDHAFGNDRHQRDLAKILFGAALTRSLWLHRIAVLLVGKGSTGKTTFLNVLRQMFPSDQVTATNPSKWANEYYCAALATAALNVVGELDANEAIPGGAFKAIVGCDVVQGRHPTHRPFSFVCQCSHFFNANRLPPTLDRSDSFFKRWRILEFTNPVREEDEALELADRIVSEEEGPVLGWMLHGAAMLQACRTIPVTDQHKRLIQKWRAANNSALEFILDVAVCRLDPAAETKGDDAYSAYRTWTSDNGLRPFGRTGFYEALDEGAGRFGVTRIERRFGYDLRGLELVHPRRLR